MGKWSRGRLSSTPIAPGTRTKAQAAEPSPAHAGRRGCDLERFTSPPATCQGPTLFFFFFKLKNYFSAVPQSMQDLSSPARDQTCAPCSGRTESTAGPPVEVTLFKTRFFFSLNFYLLYLCIRHKHFFLIIKDVNHPAQNIAETRINYL